VEGGEHIAQAQAVWAIDLHHLLQLGGQPEGGDGGHLGPG